MTVVPKFWRQKRLIYGLYDPRSGGLRYIGKSSVGLSRISSHFQPSRLREQSRKNSWIKSLLAKGLRPGWRVLCVLWQADDMSKAEAEENIAETERYYIRLERERGNDLLNMTPGGDGGDTGGGQKRRIPVVSVCARTGATKLYEHIHQTADDGFSPTKVVAVCRGKRLSHKGHSFHYAHSEPSIRVSKCVRAVELLRTGDEPLSFRSIREAAEFLGVQPNAVSCALHRHALVCGFSVEAKNS